MKINTPINELADEFETRVLDLLENAEVELPDVMGFSKEALARWIGEEFVKLLVEEDEMSEDAPCVDDPDFTQE